MRRWRAWELQYLLDHASDGAEAIAEKLGRSVHAVEHMASRERISLRESWMCPRCGKEVYYPLSQWTGWCRTCSMNESKDQAALTNRQIRKELELEKNRQQEIQRERQSLYSDTNKKKGEICRLRESWEVNGKSQVRKGKTSGKDKK